MAVNSDVARPSIREISVPSGIKGFEDRVFLLRTDANGITLREKGRRNYRRMTYRQFIQWMMMHAAEIDG